VGEKYEKVRGLFHKTLYGHVVYAQITEVARCLHLIPHANEESRQRGEVIRFS